jgi:hypothetical protein
MNVGDSVTIRVRDARNPALYASGVVREFNEYTGKILPNPKWVSSDSICISTGDTHFPFRIIDRERIMELGASVASVSAPRSETFIVQGSKPGSTYTVTRDGSHWSCTCVGFGFRKDCKHVRECK